MEVESPRIRGEVYDAALIDELTTRARVATIISRATAPLCGNIRITSLITASHM